MTELRNSSDEFKQLKTEHRALAILRALQREPSCKSNDQIMLDWLRKLAIVSTHEELEASVGDLVRLALIKTDTISGVTVFELTEKGCDVALWRYVSEGVLLPSPECPY
ncbi:MAG: hypothetical protein RIE06_15555 [Roseibium album]|jgi:hypothetical protein|uniref:hypothetical protein n=1 Tax=Hyphomicrobiales TaxID=356 RepID=UPI0032EB0B22